MAGISFLRFTFFALLVAQCSAAPCPVDDESCLVTDESSFSKGFSKYGITKDMADDSAMEQDTEHAMTLLQAQTIIQNESGVVSMPRVFHRSRPQLFKEWAVSLLQPPSCHWAGFINVTTHVGAFAMFLASILFCGSVYYARTFLVGESSSELVKNGTAKAETEQQLSYIDDPSNNYEAPIWLNRLCLVGSCLIMVNYTVVMPASAEVSSRHGGSVALSGLIIGIYSIASALSIPFMYYLSRTSFPMAFKMVGIAGTSGNLLYAWAARHNSIHLILIARFVCGLEGGAVIVFASALQKCNGAAKVPMLIARLATAGSAGLILGPTVSSATRSMFPHISPEIVPALTMAFWTTFYSLLALFVCPSHAACIANIPSSDTRLAKDTSSEAYDAKWLGASYLSLGLSVGFMIARFFQRVFWESTLLIILTAEYGYGDIASGYLLSLGLLPLLFLGLFARHYQTMGFHKFIYITEIMQFVGIALMVRIGEPSTLNFVILIIGSGLFNFSNWVQNVAYSVVIKYFAVPNHSILNVDARVALMYGLTYIGYFLGPVLSRGMVDVCLWQNLLPYALFLMFATMVLGQMHVTYVLEEHFKKLTFVCWSGIALWLEVCLAGLAAHLAPAYAS